MKINTLIIGQGIAGSMMAYMLQRKGVSFAVMDPAGEHTSSLIAAGMFTPISGKRKTLHALTVQQIAFAIDTFRSMEQLIGKSLLHLNHVYQVFDSLAERDDLAEKSGSENFGGFINTVDPLLPNLKQPYGAVEITHSGWVDCYALIHGTRNWLKEQRSFVEETFNYDELLLNAGSMQYRQIEFEHIIFCEGYRGAGNPFFNNENMVPCKGDVLTISCEQFSTEHIVKKSGMYLVDTGNHIFKAGSTYRWHNDSPEPDENGQKEIKEKLDNLLELNYTVTTHRSGIRPTTKNREVIVEQHPINKNMFRLNGLGTKGILQGPWWAYYLAEKYFTMP